MEMKIDKWIVLITSFIMEFRDVNAPISNNPTLDISDGLFSKCRLPVLVLFVRSF